MKRKFRPVVDCDETRILETIAASKAAFLAGEAERPVSRMEFLYLQSRYIQKRWWLLQGLLLTLACALLCGGETASEDIINFLLQGFDGDVNRIWQSNIFGKSLYDIAEEGLTSKIESLPQSAKDKIQETLQRIINEGSGGLICILL